MLSASRTQFRYPLPQHLAARVEKLPGVKLSGNGVSFSRDIHTEESAIVAVRLAEGKSIPVPFRLAVRSLEATDADLALIHEKHSSLKDLRSEEVVVLSIKAVNDKPLKRPFVFDESALKKFALDYKEGRTLLMGHDGSHPLGRTFGASLAEETVRGVKGNWLTVSAYAVTRNATAQRMQDITDVLTGQYSYASIGAMGGDWDFVEGEDGRFMWIVSDNPDGPAAERLESDELSLVYLGAVPGAGVSLSEGGDDEPAEDVQDGPASNESTRTTWIM